MLETIKENEKHCTESLIIGCHIVSCRFDHWDVESGALEEDLLTERYGSKVLTEHLYRQAEELDAAAMLLMEEDDLITEGFKTQVTFAS